MGGYQIEINGDFYGNTVLSVSFKGETRKGNSDIDFIIEIAQELEKTLKKINSKLA